jgi:hypothetical protein
MSKRNNVNPGQYKVGGREKPDTLAQERQKQTKLTPARSAASSPRPQKRSGGAQKKG